MKSVVRSLNGFIAPVCRWAAGFGLAVLMVMMLMTVVDITLRRAFNYQLPFSFELTENMLVIVAFCSIAYTTFMGRHISIDILVEKFPAGARKNVERVIDFLCALLFFIITWRSVLRGIHIIEIGQVTGVLEIPYYPFFFFVALGAALAGLAILLRTLNTFMSEATP